MKTTLDSVKAVTGHVIGRGIGLVCIPVVNIMEFTVECEYIWKHPCSDEDIRKTRLNFERKAAMAKFNNDEYIDIPKYMRRKFYDYLSYIRECMCVECTLEELKSILTIIERVWPMRYYKRKPLARISVNNLKWVFKMEDKYGVN